MPAPPVPPGSKTSSAGTGATNTEFTLGHGVYELYAASVKHTNGYAIMARIAYIYETGDGSEIEVNLVSGLASQYVPLCLSRTVLLVGPGKLRSIGLHPVSMAHTFNAEYRKIQLVEGPVVR